MNKYIYFILSLFVTTSINALKANEIVYIPDTNFKNYLLSNTLINSNGDNEIQLTEAQSYGGGIACPNKKIISLKGIEAFVKLQVLNVSNNLLTKENVNLSNNKKLRFIKINNNLLTELDVSMLPRLSYLDCSINLIANLKLPLQIGRLKCNDNLLNENRINLKELNQLEYLDANRNQFTSLDLSSNSKLSQLYLKENRLIFLTIKNGNNVNFSAKVGGYFGVVFDVRYNSGTFPLIKVDDGFCPLNSNKWLKDNNTNYSGCTLSTKEFISQKSLTLFPTIATEKITLKTTENIEEIQLYNSNGQNIPATLDDQSINTSNLSSGMYFLKIQLPNKQITKKFIKQ